MSILYTNLFYKIAYADSTDPDQTAGCTVFAIPLSKLMLSWEKNSADNILKYFSYFSQKTGFEMSCKFSPLFFPENRIDISCKLSPVFQVLIQKCKNNHVLIDL